MRDYLESMFPETRPVLSGDASRQLVETLVERGIAGGASYDAVIALVARSIGATVVTLDVRARLTYERIGVATEYIG